MAPRGEKHREDGDGSIFRITSKRKDGTVVERWGADFTMGYDFMASESLPRVREQPNRLPVTGVKQPA